MSKQKMGMAIHPAIKLSMGNQIREFKNVGFDSFFAYWQYGMDVRELKETANRENMEFQSLHAPPGIYARHLWYEDENTESSLKMFLNCLKECSENEIPIMVMHSFYGFDLHEPTEEGLKNYSIIAGEAKKQGVRLALENLEGEEYLASLLEYFREDENVGLCWDSGHENCYTRRNLLKEPYHGSKLMCTHLNDNLGMSSKTGERTGCDDLHLLPFDGKIDWQETAKRLNDAEYEGILMFELKPQSMHGRDEGDRYLKMTPEEYISEAYDRCARVRDMFVSIRKEKQ